MTQITSWIVNVGKKEYKLTDSQYNWMRDENKKTGKTHFWFDGFSISLPHVTSTERLIERDVSVKELPAQTETERKNIRANIAIAKKQFEEKYIKKQTISREAEEARRKELREQARRLSE